ncbi:hypothetical protein ARMGADRAFT_1092536 [Armillaria gallica]|uniref:Uncharacterized protein n=1 Tax=Armillaria gallica TaxID=47427 RepID=A0A2H3CAG9_ARMGA|nr:hypothetical protein ARMGADRAFT_1092536 [Armillaria gallica]
MVFFNLNAVVDRARFEKVLEDVLPSIRKALRLYDADDSELDLVVYNMYVLGADKNVAAMFSNGGRLWGAMHWAPLGILTKFIQRGSLTANTAPYRVAGAFGTPGSIVVRHPVEVAMHFVTQMSIS